LRLILLCARDHDLQIRADMTRTFQLLLGLLLALVFAPVAEAGPIVYFDIYRSLNVDGTVFENTTTGLWSASATSPGPTRSHRSFIGESVVDPQGHPYERIRTQGSLNAFSSGGPANLSTDLFTSFALDSPYTVDLDAFVSADDYGYAEGFFYNETTQLMLAQIIVDEETRRLQYQGVLEPGMYSYYLLAQINTGDGFHQSQARFGGDLELTQFTPVPEPATMTLFSLGVAAVAWRRRER
jgi:hypothetical protein